MPPSNWPTDDRSAGPRCKDAGVGGEEYSGDGPRSLTVPRSGTSAPDRTSSRRVDGPLWLAAYDPEVPAEVRSEHRSLCELLDSAAERWPGSPAICCLGRETSYRELRREV